MAFQIESTSPKFQHVGYDRYAGFLGKKHEFVNMYGPLVDSDISWRSIYMLGGAETLPARLPQITLKAVNRADIAITKAIAERRDSIELYRAQGSKNRMPLGMQVLQSTKVALELSGRHCTLEKREDPLEIGVYELILSVTGLKQSETTNASK